MKNIKTHKEFTKLNDNRSSETSVIDDIHTNIQKYLGKIISNSKDKEVKDHGAMLARQLNTAGGSHLMRDEITNFIYKHKDLIPELNTI